MHLPGLTFKGIPRRLTNEGQINSEIAQRKKSLCKMMHFITYMHTDGSIYTEIAISSCISIMNAPLSLMQNSIRSDANIVIHVFSFFVPFCDACYKFRVITMFGSSLLPFVLLGIHVLFMLFVFIYIY